ncbi:hypothetical protein [Seonamhaeicola sp.]|uniref:hypothetical protein n=1 Tax=Seonamhaeicola sp. TaxID=1912245 RepID=UPI0026281C16|nr:hypothetical protein [Seonamhaeicola sp.]
MKYALTFLLLLLLSSCKFFDVKKTSSEAILKEELKTFNWNEVDVYPSFSRCDSLEKKHEKMYCFQYFLKKQIFDFLEDEVIVVTRDVSDTIQLKFQVSETGVLTLINTEIDSLTVKEIPNIHELLDKSLDALPPIFPAIKRGQQVKTEFQLPIIINVE